MAHNVGDTVTLDGVECLIIYDNKTEDEWGRYIVADKNHDLIWYFAGSDYEDESESNNVINTENKYGYEWGGSYDITTGFTDTDLRTGLTNTNSLIGMNLQSQTTGWYVVWDKVSEFRSGKSDKWFVPSMSELNLIYENRNNLSGLTTNSDLNSYYWSSSGYTSNYAWCQSLDSGVQTRDSKYSHYLRVRLCRYTTDAELDKKVWTNDEIITSTELNRIENRIKELHSSYSPTVWNKDEVITKDRLNKIETQIGNDKVWEDGNVITADDLNDIENYLI